MRRFKNILCVIEPGSDCRPALERAISLAENNQTELTVASVIERVTAGIGMPDGGPISADLQAALREAQEQKLHALLEPYRERIDLKVKVLQGIPFIEVIREVMAHDHDLLIKTPEDRDWLERWFSSDDMHLLRKCPCPVWLVKNGAPKTYRRILAAVDVDFDAKPDDLKIEQALNQQILEMASSLAVAEFAELHIVYVWDAVGEEVMRSALMQTPEDQISDYLSQAQAQHRKALDNLIQTVGSGMDSELIKYLEPHRHLIKGWARKEIPLLAKRIDADLIVMGTVARTGIPGYIMGNTAETVLNQIACSVLAIKPPGFESPVTLA